MTPAITTGTGHADVTVSKLKAKPGDSLAVDAVIMEFA